MPKITLLIQRQSTSKIQILPQVQREESVILPDPPIHIQGHAIKGNHRRTTIKIHGAYRAKKDPYQSYNAPQNIPERRGN